MEAISKSAATSLKHLQRSSTLDNENPPPIPPLPLHYQRSDGKFASSLGFIVFQSKVTWTFFYFTRQIQMKKIKSLIRVTNWRGFERCRNSPNKASSNGKKKKLKLNWISWNNLNSYHCRLRIAQEIKREQDEIDLKIKDLETRGVEIEKLLRGEGQNLEQLNETKLAHIGSTDEDLLKDLLEIWRSITQLKKRDEELTIRQQELQLEHRHAQLKEELSIRLSCSSKFKDFNDLTEHWVWRVLFPFLELDKSSQDIAAEGAILSEMLEIVAKRAALRPAPPEPTSNSSLQSEPISLPVLPPQTTINPLLQHLHGYSSPSCYSSLMSGRNIYTFPSQSHNQEHEVSSDSEIDFMFHGTEHYYLCTNESLMHDCNILMDIYTSHYVNNTSPHTLHMSIMNSDTHVTMPKLNFHVVLVVVEFLVLYAAVLYYSFSRD